MSAPSAVVPRQRTRRNLELVLLILAWGLGVLGTQQVAWSTGEGLHSRFWITAAVVGVLALIAHIIVRWRVPYSDPFLLPIATLLTILGLVMIYRLDVAAVQRAERNDNPIPTPDVYNQLTWYAVAVLLFVIVLLVLRDHRVLQR